MPNSGPAGAGQPFNDLKQQTYWLLPTGLTGSFHFILA